MYLVEQQERLAASAAAKPISWGRHDATSAKLRSTVKGVAAQTNLSTFRKLISPTTEMSIQSLVMMLGAPTMATLFLHSCQNYKCALTPSVIDVWETVKGIDNVPQAVAAAVELPLRWFTWKALAIFVVWYLVQAVLYAVVPAKIGYGQKTLAGYELPYKVNGFTCYVLTHLAFFAAVYLDIIPISIIAQNWHGLFVAANMGGYALTLWAYYKAHYFPSHANDRKFSGSVWYDMFMGIEFNPRIGELWDYKLFHNGRPGIIAWTLIDISFCFSTTTGEFRLPSIPQALVLLLHAIYVIDYFYHEDWYLRTIDIAHDHFGFYLAWGDLVWLPFMYTVQAQYLHYNQDTLDSSTLLNTVIFCLGMGGYIIFRGSNNQKDYLRGVFSPKGKELSIEEIDAVKRDIKVWGKPPTFIRAPYQTSDGKTHHAMLLTCGYWGVARHLNYCGDIMMATAMGLATLAIPGGPGLVGWWYTCFLITLLIHRTRRCDVRCELKYGGKWEEYRQTVRWRILPGVY